MIFRYRSANVSKHEGINNCACFQPQRGDPTPAQGNALGKRNDLAPALKGRDKEVALIGCRLLRPFRAGLEPHVTWGVAPGSGYFVPLGQRSHSFMTPCYRLPALGFRNRDRPAVRKRRQPVRMSAQVGIVGVSETGALSWMTVP